MQFSKRKPHVQTLWDYTSFQNYLFKSEFDYVPSKHDLCNLKLQKFFNLFIEVLEKASMKKKYLEAYQGKVYGEETWYGKYDSI